MTGPPAKLGRCRSCGASIRWAFTLADRRIPLDPTPTDAGNLSIVSERASEYGMTPVVGPADPTRDRYTSHFATCPHAAEHRRPRP